MYLREGVNMERILEGQIGTQKLWPGIENTPLIVGFTKASELAFENFEANTTKMRTLRDKLVDGIFNELDDLRFNGPKGDKRSPDNANISILRAEGEALTIELSLKWRLRFKRKRMQPKITAAQPRTYRYRTHIRGSTRQHPHESHPQPHRRGYSLRSESFTYSCQPYKRDSWLNRSALNMSRIPLPYNPKVMDLFRNPKNLGKMEDATVVAVAGNPACGDMITFYLKIERSKTSH